MRVFDACMQLDAFARDAAVGLPGRGLSLACQRRASRLAAARLARARRRRADEDAPRRRQRGAVRQPEPARRAAATTRRPWRATRRCSQPRIGATPVYLDQVHGTRVVRLHAADARPAAPPPRPMPAVTTEPGMACTVQVADCLPVLFAAPGGARRGGRPCRLARAGRRRARGHARGAVRGGRLRAGRRCRPGSAPASARAASRSAPTCCEAFGADPARAGRAASRPHAAGQVAGRPGRPGARSAARGRRARRSAAATGAPSRTPHGSFRSGATASPGAWPPPSGWIGAADAALRARASRRARAATGVPSRYSTMRQRQHAVEQRR